MREPAFWYRPRSWIARLLMPAGAVYGAIAAYRMKRPGARAGVPVFCIGNYHLGGAGKTPATLSIARILSSQGENPFVVSRGYGGRLTGPIRVDAAVHSARDVGDEPLMMSAYAPVIVSRDRVRGAIFARQHGASVILLDDGFQNPGLAKDASLIVVDSVRSLGNECVFPAGPLRAELPPQIDRTDALIVIGDGTNTRDLESAIVARGRPVLRAHLKADETSLAALKGKRALAFAGIGNPERFFRMLQSCGIEVAEEKVFADHHAFSVKDMKALVGDAVSRSLALVTTEKDMVRIRSDAVLARHSGDISVLKVALRFDAEDALTSLLTERLRRTRQAAV